jgi:copper chaperone NosL
MKVHTLRHTIFDGLLAALLLLLLTACGSDQVPPPQAAVDIHKGDTCPVCGMYVDAGPGPRAEAWVQGYQAALKFGSTRDFFAYATDPENNTRLQHLVVQDSVRINWQHPSNEARTFVDARTAWYVAWQPLIGSMGPTFASFAKRGDAEAFVLAQGGEILAFSEVTPRLTSLLGYACPTEGSPAFVLAKSCSTAPHPAASSSMMPGEGPDLLHSGSAVPGELNPAPQGRQPTLLDARAH